MQLNHLSNFNPPILLRSGHVQTIATRKRKVRQIIPYSPEKILTSDDDFLNLNWASCNSSNLAILCHGLEGSSQGTYMRGMANALNNNGWDVLCWDYRGCSDEINSSPKMYHAGATEDLDEVCQHALATKDYKSVLLIGFSLGGNLALLYASENRDTLKGKLSSVISISAPIDLASCADILAKPSYRFYTWNFLSSMKRKVREKFHQYPDIYRLDLLSRTKTVKDFDEYYVAPVNGFKNAKDYWEQCSALPRLQNISVPTLLINAQDDPFLSKDCFPFKQVDKQCNLFMHAPMYGGHCGFFNSLADEVTWAEKRSIEFATRYL